MTPEELPDPLDAHRILALLNEHEVDFVVIGGTAGLSHGSAYPTYDLDVAYERGSANIVRLVRALREMDVTLAGGPADFPLRLDEMTIDNGSNFTFETRFGRFDVLAHVAGISSYADLRAASRVERIAGLDVRVASIDHLISMKRAAGRTKDRLMLEEYIVIADEQQKLAGEGDASPQSS